MTSYSDEPGFCGRCGCANGNHTIRPCKGFNKRGRGKKAEYVLCEYNWSRCTTGGHTAYFQADEDAQYMDCFRCSNHPGGAPDGFWGTEPDDEAGVLTADFLGIPWPAAEEPGPASSQSEYRRTLESPDPLSSGQDSTWSGQTSTMKRGHGRTLSEESEDPLQSDNPWDRTSAEDTDPVLALTQDLGQLDLQEDVELYVETSLVTSHVHFTDAGGNEVVSDRRDWSESSIEYDGQEAPCYKYVGGIPPRRYYTWEFGGGGGSSGGKGKGKSKSTHKGQKKNKR